MAKYWTMATSSATSKNETASEGIDQNEEPTSRNAELTRNTPSSSPNIL